MNFKIAVSGASRTEHCCKNIKEVSKEIGREIARQKCTLVTGATIGAPYFASQGFKEIGGYSVGFSPAISRQEHVNTYRLPLDTLDLVVYTGAEYTGRNLILTKGVDAMVVICGRTGTLHEFVTALELDKCIGILEKTGGTADKIRFILEMPRRRRKAVIYDEDPRNLVQKMVEVLKKDKIKKGRERKK